MSRIASGDVIYTKPTNDIYTALAGAGLVVVIVGFVLFYRAAEVVTGGSLF